VTATRQVLAGHGLTVALPQRWEGRLYLRDAAANPVLHLGNFALPSGRGDFGSGAVEVMSAQHAFVALVEYGAAELGQPLFAARGTPRLTVRDFAANQLQRTLPGQLGCQRFFTDSGRPFCLYVVLGSKLHAAALLTEVHEVLAGMKVGQRWNRL
jgi:hypothetical protein